MIRQERRARGAEAERGVFDHRAPRAHGVEERLEMIHLVAVIRRRRIDLFGAGPELGLVRVFRAVLFEERLLHRFRERVARLAGLFRTRPARQCHPGATDREDAVGSDEAERLAVAGAFREVHFQRQREGWMRRALRVLEQRDHQIRNVAAVSPVTQSAARRYARRSEGVEHRDHDRFSPGTFLRASN